MAEKNVTLRTGDRGTQDAAVRDKKVQNCVEEKHEKCTAVSRTVQNYNFPLKRGRKNLLWEENSGKLEL